MWVLGLFQISVTDSGRQRGLVRESFGKGIVTERRKYFIIFVYILIIIGLDFVLYAVSVQIMKKCIAINVQVCYHLSIVCKNNLWRVPSRMGAEGVQKANAFLSLRQKDRALHIAIV